jgi:hypothetical protein
MTELPALTALQTKCPELVQTVLQNVLERYVPSGAVGLKFPPRECECPDFFCTRLAHCINVMDGKFYTRECNFKCNALIGHDAVKELLEVSDVHLGNLLALKVFDKEQFGALGSLSKKVYLLRHFAERLNKIPRNCPAKKKVRTNAFVPHGKGHERADVALLDFNFAFDPKHQGLLDIVGLPVWSSKISTSTRWLGGKEVFVVLGGSKRTRRRWWMKHYKQPETWVCSKCGSVCEYDRNRRNVEVTEIICNDCHTFK